MSVSSNPRLVPDMIPQTSFFKNARNAMGRKRWDVLRKECYAAAGYVCEVCGGTHGLGRKHPVECHEVWQYDYATKTQRLVRLIALCPLCHMANHLGMANIAGVLAQVHAHLMKVNAMTALQVDELMSAAWAEWHVRNGVQWVLDVSVLDSLQADLFEAVPARERGHEPPAVVEVASDHQIDPVGQLVTPVGPSVLYRRYACFLPRDEDNRRMKVSCLNFEVLQGKTLDEWFVFSQQVLMNFHKFYFSRQREQLRIDSVFMCLPAFTTDKEGKPVSRYREGTCWFKLVNVFYAVLHQHDHMLMAVYLDLVARFMDMPVTAQRAEISREIFERVYSWGFLNDANVNWDSLVPHYVILER